MGDEEGYLHPQGQLPHRPQASHHARPERRRKFHNTELGRTGTILTHGDKYLLILETNLPIGYLKHLEKPSVETGRFRLGPHTSLIPLVSRAPSAAPPATRPPPSRTTTSTSIVTTSSTRDDSWELTTLGTYVWVLLDRGTRIFEPDDDLPDSKQRIWWPGKIARPPTPSAHLEVQLYDSPGPPVRAVEIRHPCASNVLSMFDPHGRARFQVPTFVPPPLPVLRSPRKKFKTDSRDSLEGRWEKAVAKLMRERAADEDEHDELPEVGVAYDFLGSQRTAVAAPAVANVAPRGRGKRKRTEEFDEDMEVDIEPIVCLEEPDHNLNIPGELVLARDKWNVYWPARVLEFIAPARDTPTRNTGRGVKKREWGYKVAYLDGTEAVIERTWFFNSDEDGFGTCKLGKWESEFADVLNDMDIDDAPPTSTLHSHTHPLQYRCPTNPPSEPFPTLPLHTQFTYVQPILALILTEQYPPVHARHLAYLRGGRGRKGVVDEAGLRGKMDPREVSVLERVVREWCLGGRNEGHHPQRQAVDLTAASPTASVIDVREPPQPQSGPDHKMSEAPQPSDAPSNAKGCMTTIDPPPFEQDTSIPHKEEIGIGTAHTETVADIDSVEPPKENVEVQVIRDNAEEVSIPPSTVPDEGAPIAPIPDHPRWCEAFEALAEVEKIDYCLNVLLPEAILQILLWREGERTSPHPLDEAEEAELHRKGEALVRQTDWVFDVMRLRAAKVRQLERQRGIKGNGGSGGLRPRRSMKIIDYQE
ncbi:hypothetical protein BD779DRAFT_1670989 [Infundibulicybe gibba]|nr:hypothetical protein BD779DRAFT_1670989 [Infundibulicybe gibba]